MTAEPPRAVLAMAPEVARSALTEDHRRRLRALVDLADTEPLATFADPRAPDLLGDAEILIGHWGCPTVDRAVLEMAPRLRLVAYAAGSVKEGPAVTADVFARGVVVTSGAAANAIPVAEYTLAAILFANKGVFLSREWLRDPQRVRARRPRPVGNYRKRVGLVGASHVGRTVIELLRPFALEVVVADPYLDAAGAAELGVQRVELDELLATSDVVSLHVPLLPSTVEMIGRRELSLMKDGAVLVNTARGGLASTPALVAELATGRISAVLDVTMPEPLPPDSPLVALPNVFLTPHVAGSQGAELERLADLVIEEVQRFVRGEPPRHPVTAADLDRIA